MAIDSGGRLDDRGRRVSVCRRSEQEVTALGRERLESRLNELVERLGHRQPLPCVGDRLAVFQRAGDLEREERVASGRLVDLRQERTRHGEVEVLADDRVQRPGVEGRTDLDRVDPLRRQAASDLESDSALRRPSDERARVRRARPEVVAPRSRSPRPTQRRAIERRRSRRAAAARRSRPEDVQHRNPHGMRIRRGAGLVVEDECAGEGAPLCRGRAASSTSARTGSRRSPSAAKRHSSVSLPPEARAGRGALVPRVGNAGRPERRLAHARIALEEERGCAVGDPGEKVPEGGELGVSSYDRSRH